MLKEIRCEVFNEKVIEFHNGLNVVLGDNVGSNSIGKSTLLMIVDFVFGGNTYVNHNKDVILRLGHHEFLYIFDFLKVKLYFVRGTEEPNIIYKCNAQFEKQEEIKLSDFNNLLKEYYKMQSDSLKFRSAVSLFSRVWGKHNHDVKRPLHSHHSEKNIETITRLIKLFNEYEKLAKEDKEIKQLNESKNVLNKAGRLKFIPKITKKVYENNLKEIEKLKAEIEKFSNSAFSPVINISEIISDELIDLRNRKNILIEERGYYKSRFNRTSKNIIKYNDVGFEKLIEFFPDVNIEKLEAIEDFHEGISAILKKELRKANQELKQKIDLLDKEIEEININLEKVLNPNEEQNVFIDNLIELSSKLKTLQLENDYFNRLQSVTEVIASKTLSLSHLKESILKSVELKINSRLVEINDSIHNDKRTPPKLELTYSNYEYKYFENTGTGKAFTNLIIFDLAIATLTELPFIIHDSFLFKNIEKAAVENLINYYNKLDKQVFISIDVINIYSKETQEILTENKVIQLSKNKLLFTLDWRDNLTEDE